MICSIKLPMTNISVNKGQYGCPKLGQMLIYLWWQPRAWCSSSVILLDVLSVPVVGPQQNQLWLIGSRRAEDKPKAKATPSTGGLAAESLTRGHAPIHLKNANPNTAAATVGGLTIPLLSAKQTQRGGGSLVLDLLCLLWWSDQRFRLTCIILYYPIII